MNEKFDEGEFDMIVSAIYCWRCNLTMSSYKDGICPSCRKGDSLQIVDKGPRILNRADSEIYVWSYHLPGTKKLVPVVCTNLVATVGGRG